MSNLGSIFESFVTGSTKRTDAMALIVARGDRLTLGELRQSADTLGFEVQLRVIEKKTDTAEADR